jgi:uncharacterized delta-60 repeat protein/uncharacterized repeat protein (TIGR01451 family)
MRKFAVNLLSRAISSLAHLTVFSAIVAATGLAVAAAPPNDNFASAEKLSGASGTLLGTNYGATAESGEPVHFTGFQDNSSVWYEWTATNIGVVTFNIGASVSYLQATELDTVMAAYSGSSLSSLVVVTNNDDQSTSTYRSAVSFPTTAGTTYYIAVDSWPGDSGTFEMSWKFSVDTNSPSFLQQTNGSAGTLFFASSRGSQDYPVTYLFADTEWSPTPDTTTYSSFKVPRVNVSRVNGAKGRVLVDYTVTNLLYTNYYFTNVQTSIDTNSDPATINAVVYYVHAFQSNLRGQNTYLYEYASVSFTATTRTNFYGGDLSEGTLTECPEDMPATTDPNWMLTFPVTNAAMETLTINLTNITAFTNITTTLTNITYVTNITQTTTNMMVTNITDSVMEVVASAEPGVNYMPTTGTVVLDDFMMSKDVLMRSIVSADVNTDNKVQAAINPTVAVVLSNPRLDPLESLDTTTTNVVSDIAAPVLDTNLNVAAICLLNSGYPSDYDRCTVLTAENGTAWPVVNFEKTNYRVENGAGPINVYVVRTRSLAACQVGYWVDYDQSTGAFDLHTFDTEPGSEYAIPGIDFTVVTGTISFPADDPNGNIQPITIPILTNSAVQFNRDLIVQLYKINQADQIWGGNVPTATVTTLFDTAYGGPQPAGSVDRTFNPESRISGGSFGYLFSYPPGNGDPGANKPVYAVACQSDGTTIIGGAFTALNGVPRNRLARMDNNGLPDLTFDPGSGANDSVTAMVLDGNQKAVIGGLFTSINGKNRYHVARLNTDGSLDTSFNPGTGANGAVWAVAVQSDGKIVIGGEFTSYNGTNRNYIARLNSDGSLDATFDPGVGPNGIVQALAVESSGSILIGGNFTTVSGSLMSSIARLKSTGAVDTTFNIGSGGIDGPVYCLVEQPDGRVIVGGSFSTVNYLSRNGIVRLKSTGSVDETFDPGTGADGAVYSVAMQSDGKVLLGGLFTTVNQTRRVGIARLYANGSVDTTFMDTAYNQLAGFPNHYANQLAYNENDLPAAANYRNAVLSMSILPSGNIVVGGKFQRVGGGFTRDDMRVQGNVARLIGGVTPGPGTIELSSSAYTVDENAGYLFVSLTRTNGNLGPVGASFLTNGYAAGPGALGGSEFTLADAYRAPAWASYWPGPLTSVNGQHANYGYQVGDGNWGPNFNTLPAPAGDAYVYLGITDNKAVDGNRTAPLSLSTPIGGLTLGAVPISTSPAIGRASSVLTVVDNDSLPGEFAFAATNYTVNENAGSITLTVLRTNGSTGVATIDYGVQNVTATNKVDFRAPTGYRLSFADGVTNQTITIPIIDNTQVQPDRSFSVFLATPTGGASLNSGASNSVVTIVDNDFLPGHLSYSITNFTVSEISTAAVISVTRRGGSSGTLSVQYAVTGGSALNNINFVGKTNTLWWDSGDSGTRTFTVPIIHDGAATADLVANLSLFNPVISNDTNNTYNSLVLASQITNATLTIINEDFNGNLTFGVGNYNIMENAGAVTFTVYRKYGLAGSISVGYKTVDGTAVSGTNYIGTTNRLNFAAGETSKSFKVTLIDDTATNIDRVFGVQLFNGSPTNVLALSGLQTNISVTIIDNETTRENAGAVDPTYLVGEGFNGFIYATEKQKDGKIVVGGDFTFANKAVRNRISRVYTDGSVDMAFQMNMAGANGTVRAIVCQTPNPSDGETNGPILIGGSFDTVNGVNRSAIARLYQDGRLDETFDPGSGVDGVIYAMAESVQSGTNVFRRKALIAGNFGYFNGIASSGIARINDDGTFDPSFIVGSGVGGTNGTIFALAIQPDGKVLAGGDFVQFNGYTRTRIVRLNDDGSVDTTFNASVDDSVRSIKVQDDGKILIAGVFTNVAGASMNHVARLNSDGTLDTNFKPGVGANDTVLTMTVDTQNKVLLGGEFTRASGVTRSRITQLNSDGTVDPGINFGYGADNFVSGIILQDDGKIIVAGGFTTFNGLSYPCLVRLFGGSMFDSGTLEFDAPSYTIAENGTNVIVTVRRLGGTYDTTLGSLAANVITVDGTAQAGSRFVGLTNLVVFPVGETFQSVQIPIIDNYVLDGNREFTVVLTNYSDVSAVGPQPQASVTILDDECGVSFSDTQYRVYENVASGMARILVQRVGNTNTAFTVDVMTLTNGTAMEGVRYQGATNTLTFAFGETNHYFYVPIIDDSIVLGDQTTTLLLTNIVGPYSALLVEPRMAALTIVEDDQAPGSVTFVSTNFFAMENDGYALVTLARTNGITGTISVDYVTTNGTAISGNRYVGTNGTVVFADGETKKQIRIPLINNSTADGNQNFSVTLSNPIGGATIINDKTAVVTIVDDDTGIGFIQQTYNVDELAGVVVLTVQRMGASNGVATVNYTTVNGTAKSGVNYSGTTNQLKFADGETFKTFSVPLTHDSKVTGNLNFTVQLSDPKLASGGSIQLSGIYSALVVIVDADNGFSFSTNTFSISEAGTNVVVDVIRSGSALRSNVVYYATSDGTAASGTKYTMVSGSLIFQSGDVKKSFIVPIINNTTVEGDTYFNVNLSSPTDGAQLLTPSSAIVNILDDDIGLCFSSPTYSVSECGVRATITVVRDGLTNNAVSVGYQANDGTAKDGVNYQSTSGVLDFAAGQRTNTFTVQVVDDNRILGDSTVQLSLLNPTGGATIHYPLTATLSILECDGTLVVPAGVALVSESFTPTNNVIDTNETVTVWFGLRSASGTTTNLQATLLATNGVTNVVTPTQFYGALTQDGHSIAMPFTFKAAGTNGQRVLATFALMDGTRTNFEPVSFSFDIGQKIVSATNSSPIVINDNSTASPYPSAISLTGISGLINGTTLTLSNLNHTYPSDIDVMVASPDGRKAFLMAHSGGGTSAKSTWLTFSDSAASSLSYSSALVSGTYKPSVNASTNLYDYIFTGAPSGSMSTNLSVFNGIAPNGVWSLYIVDDKAMDSGIISNGWSISFLTGASIRQSADLEATVAASAASTVVGNALTYTVTVTNYGPGEATNVVLSGILPGNVTYVSGPVSAASVTNGVWNYSIGRLAMPKLVNSAVQYSGTTFTLVVMPQASGLATNIIAVASVVDDPNTDNNTITTVTGIDVASADLAVTLSESPNPAMIGNTLTYTIVIANNGPSIAPSVVVTNELPLGGVVTNLPTGWTQSGTTLIGNLGDLAVNAQQTIQLSVWAGGSGTVTDTVRVGSGILDTLKANNIASVKTEIGGVPSLSMTLTGSGIQITWPTGGNFILETTTAINANTVWTELTTPAPTVVNGQNVVTITYGESNRFFRLKLKQ